MVIVLLIILYTLALIILIDRGIRHKRISLNRKEIALGFCFKVAMGILYGYIFKKYYGGDDTWRYFSDSLTEYNKLLFQTGHFFKEWIPIDSFSKYPGFVENFRDFLENLEYNTITKSLAIFNLISFQNYYTDVVFFNLFSFMGSYLLFKLFTNAWPEKRLLIYIAAFLIPSVTFWLSGIRGDGLLLLSIALVLYYFNSWLGSRKPSQLFYFILGLAGTLAFRIQFFILLIPALLAWWLSFTFSLKPWKSFAAVYLACLLLFFGSALIFPDASLPNLIVQKQNEFFQLKGNTIYHLNRLQPNFESFLITLPQAFANTFLRPLPREAKGLLQLAASAEVLFFWSVLILVLGNARQIGKLSLGWLVICFSLSTYLLIGYTVPFPGAIVRYKIIPELLFFLAWASALPFQIKKNKYLSKKP